MYIYQALLFVMPVILTIAQVHQSDGQISDLRLTNGPSAYVGNIEYSKDSGMTWHTTCGVNLTLYVVQVICRHLGFQGANRNIPNSPFGNETENAATYFTCELGNQENINNCTVNNCSSKILGAAVCYDERYVGCFKDNMDNQVLQDNQLISNDITIEKCIQHCESSSEYVYAGVKNSNECYCGDASTDFDHLGPSGDDGCQFPCAGDGNSSCGGSNSIAVFNLSVTVPSDTTVNMTISSEPKGLICSSTTDPSWFTRTTEKESSSTSTESQTEHSQGDKSEIGLYAGAGGGSGFLVILVTILIIVFAKCRRRKAKKRSPDVDQPLPPIGAGGDNRTTLDTSLAEGHEGGDPCYENKGAEKEREYQNTNELDKREYVNVPEAGEDKQTAFIISQVQTDSNQAKPDLAALYAMPELSAKSSSTSPIPFTSSDQTTDPSSMYAMPDKRAKTVYNDNGNQNKNNFGAMYATSTKARPETIGMEAEKDAGQLYAQPDKKRHDHVTQSGTENTTPRAMPSSDDVGLLYAVPDKNRGNDEGDDKNLMTENELYSLA